MVVLGYFLFLISPRPDPRGTTGAKSLLLPNTVGVYPELQDAFLFIALARAAFLVLIGVFAVGLRSNRLAVDPQPVF